MIRFNMSGIVHNDQRYGKETETGWVKRSIGLMLGVGNGGKQYVLSQTRLHIQTWDPRTNENEALKNSSPRFHSQPLTHTPCGVVSS